MKKLINLLSIILLLINIKTTCAWDNEAAKYYPLAIGNVWSYHRITLSFQSCGMFTGDADFIVRVISDTVMPNGKKYFKILGQYTYYDRIDSSTMRVYRYGNPECVIDSLLARKNDYFTSCRQLPSPYPFQVLDTNSVVFAGSTIRAKNIHGNSLVNHSYKLVYGIGVFSEYVCNFGGAWDTLNGCIINGALFGQILGLNESGENIPSSFILFQNYPNPFNPVTNIKFSVPQKAFVTITVYNVLGEEVSKLVNEEFSPGTYETSWDGSNYPSGVYYYQLTVNNEQLTKYTETKKMILIK